MLDVTGAEPLGSGVSAPEIKRCKQEDIDNLLASVAVWTGQPYPPFIATSRLSRREQCVGFYAVGQAAAAKVDGSAANNEATSSSPANPEQLPGGTSGPSAHAPAMPVFHSKEEHLAAFNRSMNDHGIRGLTGDGSVAPTAAPAATTPTEGPSVTGCISPSPAPTVAPAHLIEEDEDEVPTDMNFIEDDLLTTEGVAAKEAVAAAKAKADAGSRKRKLASHLKELITQFYDDYGNRPAIGLEGLWSKYTGTGLAHLYYRVAKKFDRATLPATDSRIRECFPQLFNTAGEYIGAADQASSVTSSASGEAGK
jgi:hypothetical protein